MIRKPWPKDRTLPQFDSYEDELSFWDRYYIPWNDDAYSEAVGGSSTRVQPVEERSVVRRRRP